MHTTKNKHQHNWQKNPWLWFDKEQLQRPLQSEAFLKMRRQIHVSCLRDKVSPVQKTSATDKKSKTEFEK